MKYGSIYDAAHAFVSEMNAVPQSMIQTLMNCDVDGWWSEVTAPSVGCRVLVYDEDATGEIVDTDEDGYYIIRMDEGYTIDRASDDFHVLRDDLLPMWGTMWSFGDALDDDWLEEDDGIQKMSDCGFRIYYHEEWGYFFGIDGAGYDFYEAHWIPLYKARGLRWHDEDGAE